MFGLILLDFVRKYKKTRKYYSEQNAAHLCSEVDNLKKQLRDCEAEIRKLNADLTAKNNLLLAKEEKINSLVFRQKFVLNSVINENEQLKTKLKQPDNSRDKITNVKKIQADNTVTISNPPLDIEASLKVLGNVHALVIGGAENWQTKLKNKLSHFTYIYGDATSFDEELIIHADIIFVNVRCKFSHNCFYKMIKLIRQYEKRIVFLSKTNISLTIHEMAGAADSSFVA